MKIGLISPNKWAYSETFIQSQKELLPYEVFYYYDGFVPKYLENFGSIRSNSILKKIRFRIRKQFGKENLPYHESLVAESFRKNRISVVLAQYGPTGEALVNICRQSRIPLIVHFHGYDAHVKSVLRKNNNYQRIFKEASACVAVSKKMSTHLIRLGCPKEKMFMHPCGPDNSFLDVNSNVLNNHFVGIGRFTDKKAPYYTIMAFNNVLRAFPDARLTLGGDGPLLNMCRNLIRQLKIENSVNLPGVMNKGEFIKYLESSLAFVQHSITAENGDCEGTPVAVLEASAAGVPVISTSHAGIKDVVIDGKTGILTDEHDVDGMTKAMIYLLENKDQAKIMGSNAKLRVKDEFSMKHYISSLSSVINGVLQTGQNSDS